MFVEIGSSGVSYISSVVTVQTSPMQYGSYEECPSTQGVRASVRKKVKGGGKEEVVIPFIVSYIGAGGVRTDAHLESCTASCVATARSGCAVGCGGVGM